MLRWITIEKICAESEYTPDAARSKIKRRDWLEGHVWIKAPDDRILIDTEGYEKRVTSLAAIQQVKSMIGIEPPGPLRIVIGLA